MEKQLESISLLRPYQRDGVKFLFERDGALLADEMGLGKTVQAAVAIELLITLKKYNQILIVCPKSVCNNWEIELQRWAPDSKVRIVRGNIDDRKSHFRLPFNVWIASYEQIRLDVDFLDKEHNFDLVILDEAQRIKNINSNLALSCRLLRRANSWALTGTPIENRSEDLISIFQFIKPGLLHSSMHKYEIHDLMKPYFLRRRKNEVLAEIPPIIIQDLIIEMESTQRIAYNVELLNGINNTDQIEEKVSSVILLSKITKLKQLCNFEPISGESCKYDALKSLLEDLDGNYDKIVVFSQYVSTLKQIKKYLNWLPVEIFHGGLNSEKRDKIIFEFENSTGPRVLLMSIKAGGVGINLSTASMILLFDRWWNPAVEEQAIHRGHRFGRQKPLHVFRFLVKDSIEDRINSILSEKQKIFKWYIDGAKIAEIRFSHEDLVRILSNNH